MDNKAHPNFNFLSNLDLDQEVESKLALNLSRIYSGNDEVFVTPIGKDNDPQVILSELDKVFNEGKSKCNDTLIDLEMSNRSKYGPRSLAIPWSDRKASLISSFEGKDSIGNYVKDFRSSGSGLRALSLANASKLLKPNTNSGLPYYTRKNLVKQRVLENFDYLINRKDPCILFTRTQEQRKTRNVWGFPMADTLNESRYYFPLLNYQKKLNYRSALISPNEVSKRITTMILSSVGRENYALLSVDFSNYDASVKSKLQNEAFEYIKRMFSSANSSNDLEYIKYRFNTIPIVTPDGVLSGRHGVPSGSTFTNEVDSICQASISIGSGIVSDKQLQVQGDDGVYLLPQSKIPDLMNKFEECGLAVNKDKSYESNNYCVYLQNLFHLDYMRDGFIGGIYPIYRALNRIVYQERWSDFEDYSIEGKDYYSIRTICILENCKYHPLFKEFVKLILKYDKYSLKVSGQGISKYVQMFKDSQGAGGILNNQYGDNVSGIRSFETFKMIKELS